MSTNEKYIGEAPIKEAPKKKLKLVIKKGSIQASHLADNSVTERALEDGSVHLKHLANDVLLGGIGGSGGSGNTDNIALLRLTEDVTLLKGDVNQLESQMAELQDTIGELADNQSGGGTPSDSTTALYQSQRSEGTRTTVAVGSLAAGTYVDDLNGKTVSQILDMILFENKATDPLYRHFINISRNLTDAVEYGSEIVYPNVNLVWNENIIPSDPNTEGKITIISRRGSIGYTQLLNWNDAKRYIYGAGVNAVFEVYYSYPTGYYYLLNDETKSTVTVEGVTNSKLQTSVNVSLPIYVNDEKWETLYPSGREVTVDLNLNGRPSISVPGANTELKILANLGLGYMEVEWEESTETHVFGGKTFTYKKYTKPDSYSETVPHRLELQLVFSAVEQGLPDISDGGEIVDNPKDNPINPIG